MSDTPPDWVLFAAAKRSGIGFVPIHQLTVNYNTPAYQSDNIFRALCDMIAKYEQPPVDPDVEAVKRILRVWCSVYDEALFTEVDERLARAVAQYKKERGK